MTTTNLPASSMDNRDTEEVLSGLGFVFGERSGDFIATELPENWSITPVENQVSALIDNRGRVRARFFHRPNQVPMFSFMTRYGYRNCPTNDGRIRYEIFDSEGDKVIHRTDSYRVNDSESLMQELRNVIAWLDNRYPDWRDPRAYWADR